MGDLLATFYPWLKSLHIISAISWMAGLLYLPRLFVYHADTEIREVSEQFKIMERRLYKFIMSPAMLATWFFGLLLAVTPGIVDTWFIAKFIFVLGLTASHVWMGKRQKDFAGDENTLTSKTYRIMNEVPTVLMVFIVIVVVVKPF